MCTNVGGDLIEWVSVLRPRETLGVWGRHAFNRWQLRPFATGTGTIAGVMKLLVDGRGDENKA